MSILGCLPILLIILVFLVPSLLLGLVRLFINTLEDIFYGIRSAIRNLLDKLFLPSPLESEIEDPDYYSKTEERPKRYSKEDGEYTSYKWIK